MLKKFLLILVFLSCFQLAGCTNFNPVAPLISLGIMWYEGEAHKYYNSDQAAVVSAVKKSLKELDLVLTNETSKGNAIYLTAGDKARFHIKVIMVRQQTTKLSIRVNVMGDKPYAELIYRHVDRQRGIKTYENIEKLNADVAN